PLGAEGHLLLARAHFGAARFAEATRELALARAELPPHLEAAAFELEGDLAAVRSEHGAAARAYTAALASAGQRALEVRAKRGGAAALASDTETALSDVAALLPDPRRPSSDARLRALAPAVWRRALEEKGPLAARVAWLEAAARLGPRRSLATLWSELALFETLEAKMSDDAAEPILESLAHDAPDLAPILL